MKSKHTSGPWFIRIPPKSKKEFEIRGCHPLFYSTILAVNSDPQRHIGAVHLTNEEIMANARLMAAAPDMLNALTQVANYLTQSAELSNKESAGDHMLAIVMDAIKKASDE